MRALAVLLVLGAACGSTPIADPTQALAQAETHLARGEIDAAMDLLEAMSAEDFTGEAVERYETRLAQGLVQQDRLWKAFKVIRDFEEEHPFSEFRGQVQDMEFAIGRGLIESNWSFLFFASDRDDGQVVLEHFIVRYPQHPSAADALRRLGEKAFAEDDWLLARERFGQLLLRHPDSEWVPLARFRIAMSSFFALAGPAYDLHALTAAHNELKDFLAQPSENPAFESTARAAYATVREWLGEKHVMTADFYRVLDNAQGERQNLERAARDFPDTEGGRAAGARLAAIAAAEGSDGAPR